MNGLIEFVTLSMVFCHVIADYNLQGWLASAKQKEWWKKNAPDEFYKHDYVMALIMHSISWSFMIMLPIALYFNFIVNIPFIIMFVVNVFLHAMIDDLKANRGAINLVQDQLLHVAQIVLTAGLLL